MADFKVQRGAREKALEDRVKTLEDKAKYVVSYYTGKTHKDGSEFYDIRIFSNKKLKNRFLKDLASGL